MKKHYWWLGLVLGVAGCGDDGGGSDGSGGAGGSGGSGDASIDAPPPSSDNCGGAAQLTFANGVAAAVADTNGGRDDTSASCGGGGGPDVVFTFTTPAAGTLTVDVRNTQGSARVVASVRTACENSASEVAGGCVAAETAGGSALLTVPDLPAGTYFLWIDSADGQAARFDVSLSLSTAAGDACAGATRLVFGAGEANAAGTTEGATDDAGGSCGGTGGLDTVYRFDLAAISDLEVTVTPRNVGLRPVVYLQAMTCPGTERGCASAGAAGANAFLRLGSVPAGTYFLWIDGATATPGAYRLTARISPPAPGDVCATARPLMFTNGMATDSGDTTTQFNDSTGSCATGVGPDLVYTFTTAAIQDFRASLTTTSSTFRPALYLRSSTCTGSELGCGAAATAGGNGTLALPSLPAGTYFLWIDGVGGTAGAYSLTATLTTPIPGDTCAVAKPLTFTGGMASDSGDTTMLFSDSTGSCATGTSPDIVYTFTISSVQNLRASVSTTSSTFRPAVYLRSASCTGSELGCGAAAVAGGTGTLAVGNLTAGTYFLWIDGVSGTSGPYSLTAALTTPVQGEGCANPKPLVFSNGMAGGTASDTGDTSMLFHETTGTCFVSQNGPDTVYSFTTNRALDLTASVSTTTSTYRPMLYLRSATCTGSELGCNVATVAGGTASLNVLSLTAGTYFLWIDTASTNGGAYSLTASLTPLPPAEVRPRTLADVTVPGPMAVAFEVVDRFGGVVTTDSSTSFTVAATGSAVFASATQGTIVSGAGTNTVLVQVSGGVVSLNATDTVAETVTYTATDTQGNGLRYPSAMVSQTSATQALDCTTRLNTFSLPFAQRPSGNATLTISAKGDFSASTEYMEVYMESTAGTRYGGNVFASTQQCPATFLTAQLTIPQADLMTHLADGVATVVMRTTASVGCFCAPDQAFVTLAFPISNSARFLP